MPIAEILQINTYFKSFYIKKLMVFLGLFLAVIGLIKFHWHGHCVGMG